MKELETKWHHKCFESGTQVVTRSTAPFDVNRLPWFYVYGGSSAEARSTYCQELAAWLNGEADKPEWIESLRRASDETVVGFNCVEIHAAGPMYDAGNLFWKTDDSAAAQKARAELMDLLVPRKQ